MTLWATRWSETGEATGCVWIDDVSLVDAATGEPLLSGGDFEPADPADLVPRFDWSAWDGAVTRALAEFGFNTFRLPVQGLGGGTFHARHEPELLGFPEASPEYQAAMKTYLGAIDAHLREKGWLDEAFVYWFDEPDSKDYEFVMNGFRKLRQWAPGLRRMLTEQVEEALVGGPNWWCPVSSAYNHDRATVRRQAGDHLVVCLHRPEGTYARPCSSTTPAPSCASGCGRPGSAPSRASWSGRPTTGPTPAPTPSRTSRRIPTWTPWAGSAGTIRRGHQACLGQRRWPVHLTRPRRLPTGARPPPWSRGPVDSIRWEMLRDGLEDYEYFVILRRLLSEKGARLSAGNGSVVRPC